jgi:hypothetical protein
MKIRSILIPLTIVSIIILGSCNPVENITTSGSQLIVQLITGTDSEGNEDSTTVFSDVMREGSVFNDTGTATLTAQLINPAASPLDLTYYYDIIVDQIDIEYSRADGLNVEGQDIPYSFSQKVYALVEIGAVVELSFVLIQHNAKLESPLVDLVNVENEKILKLEAKITFHGKDMGGHRIAPVVGHISVWCANFADPEG